jgi:hypothetical protein
MRVLMVFVDGLGVGKDDPSVNPVVAGSCPVLAGLIRRNSVAIDAALGVAGLPQSATGQTALLTGVNAAAAMGRHIEGFPGPRLRELVAQENLFRKLAEAGRSAAFANAYYTTDVDAIRKARRLSVTTVAATSAFGWLRGPDALARNEAVYQDLTRALLCARGYTGPVIRPAEAANHLAAIAQTHDFTLFEYFQTDRAGHSGDRTAAAKVLADLDAFLEALLPLVRRRRMTFVLTSDHGNIEDMGSTRHTGNPIPFVAVGPGARRLNRRVRSLVDVCPAILELLVPA